MSINLPFKLLVKKYLFIILLFSACLNETKEEKQDKLTFLKSNGIFDGHSVPSDLENWKPITSKYVYWFNIFNKEKSPQLTFILGDKQNQKILGVYNINPHILPSARIPMAHSNKFVSNCEELLDEEKAKMEDLSTFNSLLKEIPELKNFSWKNSNQNKIISGLIFLTQFYSVSKKDIDAELFLLSPTIENYTAEKKIKNILSSDYMILKRVPERLNENSNIVECINRLGFEFPQSSGSHKVLSNYSVKEILGKYSYDFSPKGKVYFFYPFIAYSRPKTEDGDIFYYPAIETSEYSYVLDENGLPVFYKKMYFVSLI